MNMVQKIKLLFLTAFSLVALSSAAVLAAPPPLDCSKTAPTTTTEAIQCGTDNAAGAPANATPSSLDNTIHNVVNLLSVAVGIAAVIMLILGGFRYITSSGNQEAVKAAKNTIMYALIGLVIAALAQVIVQFVFNKATSDCTQTATGTYTDSNGKTCKP